MQYRAICLTFVLAMAGLAVGCSGGGSASADTGGSPPASQLPPGTDPGPIARPGDDGQPVPTPTPTEQVALFRIFERSITNDGNYANKFTDVTLNVRYTSPSGRRIDFIGFYDGDGNGGQNGNVWKFRFMPDEPGVWTYTYSWSDGTPGGEGAFMAVKEGAGRGILRAYRDNPRWFAYNGTEPVFLKSYHVGAAGFTGVPIDWAAKNVYARLLARGYNHVMLKSLPIAWVNEKPLDAPADHLDRPLWSDTPLQQDLHVWKRFEQHMKWLNERDIGVHFFIGFDPKGEGTPNAYFALQRWTQLPSDEQEFYVRYVAARLAPFANIAGWNYTWETDGATGEQRLMALLDQYDPWDHLATYHDEYPASNSYDSPRYSFAGIENHGYFGNSGGRPALDSASHYQATIDAYRGKPVYMVEGNGLWRACWAKDQANQTVTRAAWAVTLAGGSFTWSDIGGCFDGPVSEMLNWPANDPVANRLDVLYDVMTKEVTFHRMVPRSNLLGGCPATFARNGAVPQSPCYALADEGREYLVYKENGGSFTLKLAPGIYDAAWIDTRTGARQSLGAVQGSGAALEFVAPSTATDWVLMLKRAS